jgi:hypothetical protein
MAQSAGAAIASLSAAVSWIPPHWRHPADATHLGPAPNGAYERVPMRAQWRRFRSSDMEVCAQGAPDDLTAIGVIGLGACFDGSAELGLKPNRDDLGGSGAE